MARYFRAILASTEAESRREEGTAPCFQSKMSTCFAVRLLADWLTFGLKKREEGRMNTNDIHTIRSFFSSSEQLLLLVVELAT